LSSSLRGGGSVEDLVAEQGEQDVAAASGQTVEGGVVFLAFGSFALVVGAVGGVREGREGGGEERTFECAVAGAGGVLAADTGAGAVGEWGDTVADPA
jgi:hypothetical protein